MQKKLIFTFLAAATLFASSTVFALRTYTVTVKSNGSSLQQLNYIKDPNLKGLSLNQTESACTAGTCTFILTGKFWHYGKVTLTVGSDWSHYCQFHIQSVTVFFAHFKLNEYQKPTCKNLQVTTYGGGWSMKKLNNLHYVINFK